MKPIIAILTVISLTLTSCSKPETFISFTYPDGKYKALLLSYDDGVIQDIKLTQLFNKHNLIGTFNLNSAYIGAKRGWPQENNDTIYQRYVPKDSLLIVYKNHEIAAHGAYHKDFIKVSVNEAFKDVTSDIKNLSSLTGKKIISLAYPFGNTNDNIAKKIKTTSITNARTVADTYTFNLPENYLIWNPTCHDSKVLNYAQTYFDLNKKELSLFYVWGHSWEFGDNIRWNNMVTFCEQVSKRNDIWSVSCGEYTAYLKALEKIERTNTQIANPKGNLDVWIETSKGHKILKAGELLNILSDKTLKQEHL